MQTPRLKISIPGTTTQRKHRKPYFWYHIHKAAGSTVCKLAEANHEILHAPSAMLNCNWIYDQNHQWVRRLLPTLDEVKNCSQRLEEWERTKFSWSLIERPFSHTAMFCPESFGYGVALRDPIKLLESMLNYVDPLESLFKSRDDQYEATPEQLVQCLLRNMQESCPYKLGQAENSVWMFFDNPVVRLLGGPEVMELPLGGVSSTHANKVLELLVKFDIVTIVEEMDSDASHKKFQDILGWNVTSLAGRSRSNENSDKALLLTDAEKDIARDMNKHDYLVYNYFLHSGNHAS
eukprot:TRINITY_DN6713_c0_g1_i1.p1 TRINITY_DN6713_c0_g1~~TRINITY_DN6713_c0_g1_i1.p1  ORF type:complete len:332 (+),score=33.80 TRINITY_DN6713_c0_g1_i1:122-997(+)